MRVSFRLRFDARALATEAGMHRAAHFLAATGALVAATAHAEPTRNRTSLSADVLSPLNSVLGTPDAGFGLSVGAGVPLPGVLLQPRLSVHYGAGPAGAHFLRTAVDFGAMWVAVDGPVSPLLGGGAGLQVVSLRGPTEHSSTGTVLEVTRRSVRRQLATGFTGYLRGGVLFLRNSSVSLLLTAEVSLGVLPNVGRPLAVVYSLGVLF